MARAGQSSAETTPAGRAVRRLGLPPARDHLLATFRPAAEKAVTTAATIAHHLTAVDA